MDSTLINRIRAWGPESVLPGGRTLFILNDRHLKPTVNHASCQSTSLFFHHAIFRGPADPQVCTQLPGSPGRRTITAATDGALSISPSLTTSLKTNDWKWGVAGGTNTGTGDA